MERSFTAVLDARVGELPLAEQRIARFFAENKRMTVLESAAQIAKRTGTSDATVVRAAKSLGFAGLADLREAVLADLVSSPTPEFRLRRTLDEVGTDASAALHHALDVQEVALAALRSDKFADDFSNALELLSGAAQRHVFGIGPSGAVARYASLQLCRIGLRSSLMDASGIGLGDQLLHLGRSDAVLMFAYGPTYQEVETTIEQARRRRASLVLVTDNLGIPPGEGPKQVLTVPRGKVGHLAMHSATMLVIDAMIVGLAAKHPDNSFESLEELTRLRGSLDKNWLRRGVALGRKTRKQERSN